MTDFSLALLRDFEQVVRAEVPEFRIGFKDQSALMRWIGFLFPVNSGFPTRSVTSVYPTVYFPSRKFYEGNPRLSLMFLAHEMVHLIDSRNKPFWNRLLRLLPQALSVIPLIAFGVLAGSHAWILGLLVGMYLLSCLCAKKSIPLYLILTAVNLASANILAVVLTHWTSVALFLGLLLSGPWPSTWRAAWELRGYAMHLAITHWLYGSVPNFYRDNIATHFTGIDFYYMTWSSTKIRNRINDICSKVQTGYFRQEFPYSVVYEFISKRGLLRG